VDAETISSDPNVVENYTSDRLNHARMTPRLFSSIQSAIRDTLSRTEDYAYPVRFYIPGQDRLVDADVTRKFFDHFHCAKKDAVDFNESRHEGMNDIQKEKFMASIEEWISTNTAV
jgi:alpha-beta hydrolase superfamily lysophospholipase